MANVLGVVIGVRTFSSRSVIDRGDTKRRVTCVVIVVDTGMHTLLAIDPDDPLNMPAFLAFERSRTQAAPQSFCLNNTALWNMPAMSFKLDTTHLDISPLNAVA